MTHTQRDQRLGYILVTIAVVVWSTAGLFTRILTVDTQTILFWRSLYGAMGLFLVIALLPGTGGLAVFRRLNRHGLAYSVLSALSMLFFVSAMRNTSVAHAAVITAIVPFLAAWLGWVLLKEPPGISAIMASMAALIGVAIMVGVGTEGKALGNIHAALMALCMGGMILISRRHPNIPALAATCLAGVLTTVTFFPFAMISGIAPTEMGLLVLFGLSNQIVGFGLFALGARLLPPTQTALLTTLEAPLAPLWVWLLLGETYGLATLAGGFVVLAAVILHLHFSNR